jgi:hypothetical protein
MVRSFYTPDEKRLPETLKALGKSVQDAQRATGTEKNQTLVRLSKAVDYMTTLRTYSATGNFWSTGTIPRDQTVRWDDGTMVEIGPIDIPWNKAVVTASAGEASVSPGTDAAIIALISFRVFDAFGAQIGSDTNVQAIAGRLYSLGRMGLSISSGPRIVVIDPVIHPGPYTVRLQFGHWASITGTGDPSITFNAPTLHVQIIGDGVPD